MDDISRKIQEAYEKSIINEGDFIDDSKIVDKIFKELEIAANEMIMKKIIPEMKKVQDRIYKKYNVDDYSTMNVRNFGTAMIHDVFRQLIGQSMLSVSGGLKRIKR